MNLTIADNTFGVLSNISAVLANSYASLYLNNLPSKEVNLSIAQTVDDINKQLLQIGKPNISLLNYEHLQALGFGLWDEDSDLMLLPLWVVPFIEPVVLTSINGKDVQFRDIYNNKDFDIRHGCIAYGIIKEKPL